MFRETVTESQREYRVFCQGTLGLGCSSGMGYGGGSVTTRLMVRLCRGMAEGSYSPRGLRQREASV